MPVSNMENNNSREDLERLKTKILDNLKHVEAINVDHSNYRKNGNNPIDKPFID